MSPIIKQASYWWFQLLVPIIQPLYYPTIEFERYTDPAYIPYYSAMDLRNGTSLFDVCVEPESTSWHDVLPPDILEEIVNEVILTDMYFQHTNVIGNWSILGKKVVAGNYVTNLLPQGDVVVHPGGNLDIQASGTAMLRNGFHARYGSELHIKVDPALYFECNSKNAPQTTESLIDKKTKTIIDQDFSGSLRVSLFPNPAVDMINLQISGKDRTDLNIEIFDSFAQIVLMKYLPAGTDTDINISHLRKGNYVVRVSNGTGSASCRLIKM
jgi:hypothetical protein